VTERNDKIDWVSAWGRITGYGDQEYGGGRLWNECVKIDIKRLGLVKDDAHNQDMWRSLTTGSCPTPPQLR